MKQISEQAVQSKAAGWPRLWHPEKVRFRQVECDHAVRHAVRSRNLAIRLIDQAQADNIITSQQAEEMRARIG